MHAPVLLVPAPWLALALELGLGLALGLWPQCSTDHRLTQPAMRAMVQAATAYRHRRPLHHHGRRSSRAGQAARAVAVGACFRPSTISLDRSLRMGAQVCRSYRRAAMGARAISAHGCVGCAQAPMALHTTCSHRLTLWRGVGLRTSKHLGIMRRTVSTTSRFLAQPPALNHVSTMRSAHARGLPRLSTARTASSLPSSSSRSSSSKDAGPATGTAAASLLASHAFVFGSSKNHIGVLDVQARVVVLRSRRHLALDAAEHGAAWRAGRSVAWFSVATAHYHGPPPCTGP